MNAPMSSVLAGENLQNGLQDLVDRGFKAIKMSFDGFGHRDNERSAKDWAVCEKKLLESARTIVGDDITLMLDAYGSNPDWTPDLSWAVDTAKVLEELNYLWFEEPLRPDALNDYVRLTGSVNIAIAGGEDNVLTSDFERLSELKTVNILQPDCTRVGGLTAMQAIRSHATSNNIDLIPHGWNTAVGLAADIQLQATSADEELCMVEVMPHPSINDVLEHNPFALDDEGKIAVPTGAGLGVTLRDRFRLKTFLE